MQPDLSEKKVQTAQIQKKPEQLPTTKITCRHFAAKGRCKWGSECRYVHKIESYRTSQVHPETKVHFTKEKKRSIQCKKCKELPDKTKICRDNKTTGTCRWGSQCVFQHQRKHIPHVRVEGASCWLPQVATRPCTYPVSY
jgi:hypothetical protein